jgi:hypothetical protein
MIDTAGEMQTTIPSARHVALIALLVLAGSLAAVPAAAQGAAGGWLADSRNGCKLWATFVPTEMSARWDGPCSNGYASGRGAFVFLVKGEMVAQGEAEFRDGKRHGHGFLVNSEGIRVEGEYTDGNLNGHVIETWPDGSRYIGAYRDNQRDGFGALSTTRGESYDGDWRAGKQEGRGIMVFADGGRYEGEFKNGKPDGMGIYRGKNLEGKPSTWSGQWHNGCFSSNGSTSALNTTRAECGFK